ncbi:uncharacterized protein LOC133286878 [Gastrolobium bilobum]|uniref:uncharacterized protein LOC133286878 n=1 Tax=Gastrolobium bilobum TaxID=150636 RepID=UPI002AB08551|nr:uncharacterized protein LOC133286878 [Gastrolobium bilobum]
MGILPITNPKCSTTNNNNNNNKNNMGLLLVLFPQDKSTTTTIADKTKLNFPSTSKSLFSKAQSTISICAILLFFTLILFTLSTIPNTPSSSPLPLPPRFLLHKTQTHKPHFALQRMGTLHRRGTRAMTNLLVCHVSDETPLDDFRFFVRLLHRSTLTASTDVVFLFASPSSVSTFAPILRQENNAFFSFLRQHSRFNSTRFNLTRFFFKEPRMGEPEQTLWGNKKIRSNFDDVDLLSYGSVLSFDATELDPENSLAGFLDRVPLSLRRWACYPMLLGRVRRNFKHVMLVDVKSVLILNDPLGRVRNRSPESVLLFTKAEKHGKKTQRTVLSTVVMGGARGVRRLSNAVLVEIVRAAIQHKKKKNSVSESAILSQLVGDEFMLKNRNINLIPSSESIPEASSLGGHHSGASTSLSDYAIIQRGASNHDLNSVFKKQICSCMIDSSVYKDC